ncbi:MAG: DUF4445 domain-containing protein [Desulfuromonadales bacterium]|nr:DUF4445 domain-containing protein [Desulfuromonadales bacterium]
MYAIAIDLGTTTLAVSLIETASGERLAMSAGLNPQRSFGADVVSRLAAAVESDRAQQEMTALIRSELQRLAHEVCRQSGVAWSDVGQVAIAGNPAMQHLLLGLAVRKLAFPPYRPLYTCGTHLAFSDLGWEGGAEAYVFPMPGGFVGGDTVAFLFGERGSGTGDQEPGTGKTVVVHPSPLPAPRSLYLDMGTNGEMALEVGDTIWATSAAAGPAFEGGNLSCGMAALPGAISSLRIDGERVQTVVIGNVSPQGICGSGVIEAITQLLGQGVIEPGGRMRDSAEIPSNLAGRVLFWNGENAFVLHRDAQRLLLLSQTDIRQIQLATGAIRAGLEVLYTRAGISPGALERVVLTGSFGAVLRPEWLKTVGIFDEGMVHITTFIPTGALAGAERALMCADRFDAVERLADRFRVVPLSGTALFEKLFLKYLNFPGHEPKG